MKLNKKLVSALLFVTCIFSISVSAEVTVTMYLMSPKKSADISNTVKNEAKKIGTITFKNSQYGGLMIIPSLHGLPAGMHGMHLHAMPSCDHDGKDAGDHYDPNHTGKHLGPYNSNGHLGDLPVLYVDTKGVADHPILAPRLTEKDLYQHAVIIHAGDDNYSDFPKPLGGGGDRIACGMIKNPESGKDDARK